MQPLTPLSMVVPVEILHPDKWWKRTRYRIMKPIDAAGVQIASGKITDGASVPRLLWPLFPPVGRYLIAAAVHDHLLEAGVPWRIANRKFKQILVESTIPRWRRRMMVAGVSIWGFYKGLVSDEKY